MRFWSGNNSLPVWLKAGAFLLRSEVHQQLVNQYGYSNNTSLALDQLSLQLFAMQHPAATDRNHSQPLYSNQLVSPLAMFSALVMLHTFAGSSTPSARHVRRETLRRFGLDEFRQQLHEMHRQLNRDLSGNPKQWRSVCIHSHVRLHSQLPLNRTFLERARRTFEPLLHIKSDNLTAIVRQPSKRNEFSDEQVADSLCAAFVRDSVATVKVAPSSRFLLDQWIQMQDQWSLPFNALHTHRHVFQNIDGTKRSTLFMELRAYMHLQSLQQLIPDSDGHVLRLPYSSGAYAIYLIGGTNSNGVTMSGVHEKVRLLNATTLHYFLQRTSTSNPIYAQVRLPRFRLQSTESISMDRWVADRAQITHPFNCDYVNFRSILTQSRPLCLYEWTHRARLSVDELGSGRPEVAGYYGDAHQEPADLIKQITFDRPFVVLVRNEPLQATLLIGSVNYV